jgi:predicted DNA-binding WGR domain protein
MEEDQGIGRFYSLMIERDLFGTVRLVRNWGRIGTKGQAMVEVFADELEALVSAIFSKQKGPGCPEPLRLLMQRS